MKVGSIGSNLHGRVNKMNIILSCAVTYEPREKTGLQGFRPGPTQTGLYNHRRWLDA